MLVDGRYQVTVPIPLVFVGGPAGFGGDGGNRLLPVGYMKRQQQYELEADDIAVSALAAAGFDPGALLNYIVLRSPSTPGRRKNCRRCRLSRCASAI